MHFQASRDGCGAAPRGPPLAFGLQHHSAFSKLAERSCLAELWLLQGGTTYLAGKWLPVAGALLRFVGGPSTSSSAAPRGVGFVLRWRFLCVRAAGHRAEAAASLYKAQDKLAYQLTGPRCQNACTKADS